MGTKKKDKKSKKTTTKNNHIVTSYKGVLDIAKSGMGFVMVSGLDNDILVYRLLYHIQNLKFLNLILFFLKNYKIN